MVFLIQGELPKVSPSTPLLPSLTSMVKLLTDKARKWSEREKASGRPHLIDKEEKNTFLSQSGDLVVKVVRDIDPIQSNPIPVTFRFDC